MQAFCKVQRPCAFQMMFPLLSVLSPPIQVLANSGLDDSSVSLRSPGLDHKNFRKLNSSSPNAQVSPSIVVIIIVLTIIFFLSAFLHLLIRWLARNPRRNPGAIVTLTALQGQLQQLFHMHDSGIEQALIDALPVFMYKTVTGLKEGADCAICLCEFQSEDRLRLLPSCSHAFHTECIDTWLLAHSTCPLCRRGLQPECWDLPSSRQAALLLDSCSSSVQLGCDERGGELQVGATQRAQRLERNELSELGTSRSRLEHNEFSESGASRSRSEEGIHAIDSRRHSQPLGSSSIVYPEGFDSRELGRGSVYGSGRRVSVQLGRCRMIEQGSSRESGSRRSYSKGSYEYVVDPSNLEVVIDTTTTPYRPSTVSSRRIDVLSFRRSSLSTEGKEICMSPISSQSTTSCWASASFRRFLSAEEKVAPADIAAGADASVSDLSNSWVAVDVESTATSTRADAGSESASTSPETNRRGSVSMRGEGTMGGGKVVLPPCEPAKRAVSFRLPSAAAAAAGNGRLKASESRRALSETEVAMAWEGWEAALPQGAGELNGQRSVGEDDAAASCRSAHRHPSSSIAILDWLVGW